MKYIICSTLHDPDGGLAIAAEGLERPPIEQWRIYATDKTSEETLDRLSGYGWIWLEVKRPDHNAPNMMSNGSPIHDPIESDHMSALEMGSEASGDDIVHYVDGDRLLMGLKYFCDDVQATIGRTTKLFRQGAKYVSHVRSRKAFSSHTVPMKLTESVLLKAYRDFLGLDADPASTSHVFSGRAASGIISKYDKGEGMGKMSYPHAKWLLLALNSDGCRERAITYTTGMSLGYETAFAMHKQIASRLGREDFLQNYMESRRAFANSGIEDEVQFREWPHRIEGVLTEWLRFLNDFPMEGNKHEVQRVLSRIEQIDINSLKQLTTRQEREEYCRPVLESIYE